MAKKKKRSTKAETERLAQKKKRQQNNLSAIILIVVALFFALSVYFVIPQLGWLATFGKGLLGVGIYLLPVALIYIAVNVILPEKKVPTPRKVGSAILLLLTVGMIVYLFCAVEYTESFDFVKMWEGGTTLKSGGVLPGIVSIPLIMLISRWGLGIILAAILLFTILSITDRTLYDLWCVIAGWFKKEIKPSEAPEREVEPVELPTPPPARYPSADPLDVPIETYEVADDGLDEDGQPIEEFEEPAPIPEPAAAFSENETGLAVFTYDDVDKSKNIAPEDIHSVELDPVEINEEEAEELSGESEEFDIPTEPVKAEQMPMYVFPPLSLLQKPKFSGGTGKDEVEYNSKKLLETLRDFGVEAKMLGVSIGPNVTRYELQPQAGTKVSKITGLSDDIALSLAATQVRIEAPIPGKAAVGIEIPNQSASTVYIRDLLDSEDFTQAKSPLTVALGKDISGKNIYADLSKMPHLLIAGSTGSGKSVCINTILMSLLYKSSP